MRFTGQVDSAPPNAVHPTTFHGSRTISSSARFRSVSIASRGRGGVQVVAGRPRIAGFDETDSTATRLAVGDDPDAGADAGVVEHLLGQSDDRFEPVVLQNPAADLALAGSGAAGEQRRAEGGGEQSLRAGSGSISTSIAALRRIPAPSPSGSATGTTCSEILFSPAGSISCSSFVAFYRL